MKSWSPLSRLSVVALLLAGAALTGCENKTPPPPYQPPEPKTENSGKLMQPQRDALDKAKGVSATLEKADAEKKETLEKLD